MTSYSEASRVHDRYPADAILAADRAARREAAKHAPESTCTCVGAAALAALLEVTEGPADPATPSCQKPQYPEHDKLAAVKDQSQAIGEFLNTSDYTLCRWNARRDEYEPMVSIEAVLAEHFGIDLVKLDQEKRAMLEHIREANKDAELPR